MDDFDVIDIGNVFDGLDETVIRFLVALSMAANDLVLNTKLIRQYGNNSEGNYFFRLAFSHLREIAKCVGESKKDKKIQIFIGRLDQETQKIYDDLVVSLGELIDTSLTKEVLKPIRDECFHYPDIKEKSTDPFKTLPQILRSLDKKEIRFSKYDKTFLGCRYLFSDLVVGFTINRHLSKDVVNRVSSLTVSMILFIDYSLTFLKKIQEEKEAT